QPAIRGPGDDPRGRPQGLRECAGGRRLHGSRGPISGVKSNNDAASLHGPLGSWCDRLRHADSADVCDLLLHFHIRLHGESQPPEFTAPKPSAPFGSGRTGRLPIAPAQHRPPPAALPLPGPEGPSMARCTPLSAADHRRDLHSARSRDIDLFESSSRNSRNQSSSRNHLVGTLRYRYLTITTGCAKRSPPPSPWSKELHQVRFGDDARDVALLGDQDGV